MGSGEPDSAPSEACQTTKNSTYDLTGIGKQVTIVERTEATAPEPRYLTI
jgi:hypothetical protein